GTATYRSGCGTSRRLCVELRAGLSGARHGIDSGICLGYAFAYGSETGCRWRWMVNARHRARKRSASRSSQKTVTRAADAAAPRRAAIFRNGRNQAVRLPQDLAFPQDVKEVQVSRRGDAIVLSPVRRDWASFCE